MVKPGSEATDQQADLARGLVAQCVGLVAQKGSILEGFLRVWKREAEPA